MIEKTCNLWLESATWRCIPTSGATTPDGSAILDSGLGKEAVQKFFNLDADLGRLLTSCGNHVHELRPGLLSFPIKQYHWSGVNLPILQRSAQELAAKVGTAKTLLPRPPLGPTDPPWEEIAKALASLPDNIIVVDHK
ncbi:MAG: ADP-ribose-binding protein [Planctomycetes bacterium]|nr:ADP-ribose-binding protein [Planctomycetota bacterium]